MARRYLRALLAAILLASSPALADGITNGGIPSIAPAAWTPTDASGAGLSLSGASASYTQIGNMVFAYAAVTYPSTADGSAAVIGGLPITVPSQSYARQCRMTYSNIATAVYLLPVVGTKTFGIFNQSGATVLNSAMTTGTIIFECVYPAS